MTDVHEQTPSEEIDELLDDKGELDESKLKKVAAKLTDTMNKVVLEGVGPLTGSAEWAESRLRVVQGDRYDPSKFGDRKGTEASDVDKVIKRLITESVVAAGSAGFVTGLGGFIVLPITLPASIAGALIINVRLAGAVAYLRGYELRDPHTQVMVSLVAVGANVQSSLAAIGTQIGVKLTQQALKKLPISVIHKINARVGTTLLAKYGTKRAVITLAKAIPFVGGVVGGGVDAALTGVVGTVAKKSLPALI